jgi:hypothetical protein
LYLIIAKRMKGTSRKGKKSTPVKKKNSLARISKSKKSSSTKSPRKQNTPRRHTTIENEPFAHLPNEMILSLCERLPNDQLTKLMQTSKRIRDVCSALVPKRMAEMESCHVIDTPKKLIKCALRGPVTTYSGESAKNISLFGIEKWKTLRAMLKQNQLRILKATYGDVSHWVVYSKENLHNALIWIISNLFHSKVAAVADWTVSEAANPDFLESDVWVNYIRNFVGVVNNSWKFNMVVDDSLINSVFESLKEWCKENEYRILGYYSPENVDKYQWIELMKLLIGDMTTRLAREYCPTIFKRRPHCEIEENEGENNNNNLRNHPINNELQDLMRILQGMQ